MAGNKKYFFLAIKLLVSVLLLSWLIDSNIDSIYQISHKFVSPFYFLPAFGIILIAVPLLIIYPWQYFLKLAGINERFFNLYRIHHVAQFYGLFLPSTSGSIPVQVYMVEKKHPEKKGIAGSTVLAEKLFSLWCLVLLALAGSYLIPKVENIITIRWVLAAILAGIPVVLLISNRLRNKINSQMKNQNGKGFLGKINDYLYSLAGAVSAFPFKKAFSVSFLPLLSAQAATILIVWFLFLSFGADISVYHHFAFVPLGYLSALLPITIGGLGVREGIFVYFYGLIGIDPGISLAVSLANYLVLTVTPGLVGGGLSLISRYI